MGDTKISWADKVWNPVTGCTKVSPGCAHCYAEAMSLRFGWSKHPWTPEHAAENVVLHPDRLTQPNGWRKPQRVFVCSMGDLFHEAVPDAFILSALGYMAVADRHTFLILTKRPERMAAMGDDLLYHNGRELVPLPNVHLGVSVENQAMADERIPKLLETPAAVHFLSCEPLLGPVDLAQAMPCPDCDGSGSLGQEQWGRGREISCERCHGHEDALGCGMDTGLDLVIVGGESGPGHRPMDLAHVQALSDQCEAAGVAYFGKSLGGKSQKTPLPGHLGRRELV